MPTRRRHRWTEPQLNRVEAIVLAVVVIEWVFFLWWAGAFRVL